MPSTKEGLRLFLAALILAGITPAKAQSQLPVNRVQLLPICRQNYLPYSYEKRMYRNEILGFRLDVPANYRIILRENNTVAIVNPGIYSFLQCAIQSGIIQDVTQEYATISISSLTVASQEGSLQEIIQNEDQNISFTEAQFDQNNGREIVSIRYLDEVYTDRLGNPQARIKVYFMSLDNKYLVSLDSAISDNVATQSLSTLQLE